MKHPFEYLSKHFLKSMEEAMENRMKLMYPEAFAEPDSISVDDLIDRIYNCVGKESQRMRRIREAEEEARKNPLYGIALKRPGAIKIDMKNFS